VSVAEFRNLPIDLRVAELLAARLCHDLIGPVAAVANGAELLADEDAEFARDAISLVGHSARNGNRRLQFYRFAYGFTGGGVTGPPPYQLAADFFEDGSVSCEYGIVARELPIEQQKLACNMLAIAAEQLIRGGGLVLDAGANGPELDAMGQGNGFATPSRIALSLDTPIGELTSRTVGAYFAGLLAERLGYRIGVIDRPGGFRLALVPRDGAG
jgi:histidine phosphotransferase ChpT